MPVLSSKSRDFLGSIGLGLGAGPEGQKFANDLAQEMGAPQNKCSRPLPSLCKGTHTQWGMSMRRIE